MNFDLSDEQVQIRDTFARFCDERIAPRAAEIDEAHAFPRELFGEVAALGFFGKLLADTTESGEDLGGAVDVLRSILPDGFEALGILAGEQGEPRGDRGDAKIPAA